MWQEKVDVCVSIAALTSFYLFFSPFLLLTQCMCVARCAPAGAVCMVSKTVATWAEGLVAALGHRDGMGSSSTACRCAEKGGGEGGRAVFVAWLGIECYEGDWRIFSPSFCACSYFIFSPSFARVLVC